MDALPTYWNLMYILTIELWILFNETKSFINHVNMWMCSLLRQFLYTVCGERQFWYGKIACTSFDYVKEWSTFGFEYVYKTVFPLLKSIQFNIRKRAQLLVFLLLKELLNNIDRSKKSQSNWSRSLIFLDFFPTDTQKSNISSFIVEQILFFSSIW